MPSYRRWDPATRTFEKSYTQTTATRPPSCTSIADFFLGAAEARLAQPRLGGASCTAEEDDEALCMQAMQAHDDATQPPTRETVKRVLAGEVTVLRGTAAEIAAVLDFASVDNHAELNPTEHLCALIEAVQKLVPMEEATALARLHHKIAVMNEPLALSEVIRELLQLNELAVETWLVEGDRLYTGPDGPANPVIFQNPYDALLAARARNLVPSIIAALAIVMRALGTRYFVELPGVVEKLRLQLAAAWNDEMEPGRPAPESISELVEGLVRLLRQRGGAADPTP